MCGVRKVELKTVPRAPLPRSHDSSRPQLYSIATPDGGRQPPGPNKRAGQDTGLRSQEGREIRLGTRRPDWWVELKSVPRYHGQ